MLSELQAALVRALFDPDPAGALEHNSAGLDPDAAQLLSNLDPDALVVTRRIVRKLRLQRLAADPEIGRLMESDPDRFRELFRKYDAEVLPTSSFAEDEVRAFRNLFGVAHLVDDHQQGGARLDPGPT